MDQWQKFQSFLKKHVSVWHLLITIMVLLIVYLIQLTHSFWMGLGAGAFAVLFPFLVGFMISYLLHPLIMYFERKFHIKRVFSIPVLYILFFAAIVLLLMNLLPSLINDSINFFGSIANGIQQLLKWYTQSSADQSSFVIQLLEQLQTTVANITTWLPSLSSGVTVFIQRVVSNFLQIVTFVILAVVISLYFIFDYEKLTVGFMKGAGAISLKLRNSLLVINDNLSAYLRSLVVLFVIKFIEYAILYAALGHRYWAFIALIMAIGLLIPYLGGIFGNILGILTALSLPIERIIILCVAIVILSNIDSYVISPLVYKKKIRLNPIISLLSIFVFGRLLGVLGILIAIPVYLSIRGIVDLMHHDWIYPIPEEKKELIDEKTV